MNIKMLAVLSCLMLTGAAAQGLDWNADPVVQLRAAMAAERMAVAPPRAVVIKQAVSAQAPASSAPSVRIFGRPLGPDHISRDTQPSTDQMWIVLNSDKDRVGAEFTSCYGDTCDGVNFVFTELTVDRTAKVIKLGDEVVATLGGFWKGIRLAKGWRLVATRTQENVDYGFERGVIVRVRMTLEKQP